MLIKIFDQGLNEEIAKGLEDKDEVAVKDFSIRFAPGEIQVKGEIKKGFIPLKLLLRIQVLQFVFNRETKRIILKINELKPKILATDLFLGKLISARVPYLKYEPKEKIIDIDLSQHKSIQKREEKLEEVLINRLTIESGVLVIDVDGLKDVEEMVKGRSFITVEP